MVVTGTFSQTLISSQYVIQLNLYQTACQRGDQNGCNPQVAAEDR